jgi:uncharacterized protein DUF1706
MKMKAHILGALREKFDDWEELLASLIEQQIAAPLTPSPWSLKDVIAHLRCWQQRSIARIQAAQLNRSPEFPVWVPGLGPDEEGSTDKINAWIFETNRERPWAQVHQDWRDGFMRFLELGDTIPEPMLLGAGVYQWLGGHALSFVLTASYDHHQEHYEKVLAWLEEKGKVMRA